MKLQAVNNVVIILKDRSEISLGDYTYDITQIPEPYSGVIDSMGFESDEFKIGERVAFCDMGGVYIKFDEDEYVVLTPDMIIGKLN